MKLLVVEDSERLRRSLSDSLTRAGYAVDLAADGEEALALLDIYEYEVIILDLMLPGASGLDVLRSVRRNALDVHVLILSARDRVEDRVEGLNLGADDYLVKPFHLSEVQARLQALMRRRFQIREPMVQRGRLELDLNRRQVRVDGEPILLTPSEYALLEILVLRPGQVYSRSQLLYSLYQSDSEVSENAIEFFVSGLRKKLGAVGGKHWIRTRRGVGYFFDEAFSD